MILKKLGKSVVKNAWLYGLGNLIGGIGLGALLTNTFVNPHPVRFGVGFLVVAVLIYLLAYIKK